MRKSDVDRMIDRAEEAHEAAKQREWKGLTDEERDVFVKRVADYYGYGDKPLHLTAGAGFYVMANAIEAKLREKNTGETK